MRNFIPAVSFSAVSIGVGAAMASAVAYIGLIAVVMSYAVLTVEYSQSVKNDEAAVALLEAQYLAALSHIESTDYIAIGYAKPDAQIYVPLASVTALR